MGNPLVWSCSLNILFIFALYTINSVMMTVMYTYTSTLTLHHSFIQHTLSFLYIFIYTPSSLSCLYIFPLFSLLPLPTVLIYLIPHTHSCLYMHVYTCLVHTSVFLFNGSLISYSNTLLFSFVFIFSFPNIHL